jgi:hypothetical protein
LLKILKISGKMLFAKDFGNFCFPKNIGDPLPLSPTFSGKIFTLRKIFSRGALEWKGAQILEYTPQPETGWHGPA